MRLRSIGLLVLLISVALGVPIGSIARAGEANIEAMLGDQKATLDKDNQLHLDATASINAPADKVYDALTHPERFAKYDADITDAKVVAHDANGKTVEFKGQVLPVANPPPSFRVQFSFDHATKSVSAQVAGKFPMQFHTETEVTPSRNGRGTDIQYTSVSSYPGPIMGFDPTESMRTLAAINIFMEQMHDVSMYIQNGGK